ncbi:MAG: FHA domain-containing protein [Deltaproteobacteria bacterium]|nr:FHA domain-containing protein [Deltaproteobacteria bacterium]
MIEQVKVQIRQPGHPDRVVPVPVGTVHMGRSEDNDIVLADVGVSRRHARIVVTQDSVRIEDLGSGNGTYYGGFRVQSQVLKDGDEVVLDPFVLSFRIQGQLPVSDDLQDPTKAPARLEVIIGKDMTSSVYAIGPRGVTMGRSENREVIIPDPAASRHHCSVLPRGSDFFLRDMGSANGVFVNAVRTREAVLSHGDRIRIGNTELRFMLHESLLPEATPGGSLHRAAGGRSSQWLGAAVGGAVGVFLLLIAVAAVVVAGAAVMLKPSAEGLPVVPPQPPAFTIQLPPGLAPATVQTLFESGLESTRQKQSIASFEAFYRVLQADPGNTGAKYLIYMAGEFVVLDSLEASLSAGETARIAREAERDLNIDRARRGSRRSVSTLRADNAQDRVVQEAMGWDPDEVTEDLLRKMERAKAATGEQQWRDAVTLYDEVIATTALAENQDLAWLHSEARAARKEPLAELAKQIAVPWRAGVTSVLEGHPDEARAAFSTVLALDPNNIAARYHMELLNGEVP